jgi:ribosomal protein S18 acetylase RimI-like enzyme
VSSEQGPGSRAITIQADVAVANLLAIALYRKFGFLEEGRQPRQIKLGPGEYQELILMYRWVGGEP